jgi:hypothetical protein
MKMEDPFTSLAETSDCWSCNIEETTHSHKTSRNYNHLIDPEFPGSIPGATTFYEKRCACNGVHTAW